MSQQIDTALVQSYDNAFNMALQQNQSKLMGTVQVEVQNAEYAYHDFIGSTSVSALTTRHADTVYTDTPHTRRRIGLQHFAWSDLIDNKDKLQMNADPTSAYVMNAVAAINRQRDQLVVDAFDASVSTGKTGSTTTTFSSDGGSTIAVDYQDGGGGSDSNLTVDKLREARRILETNEAADDELYFVISPSAKMALLRDTEVTSSDYNAIKALVNGEINTFMGFNFVTSNRLDIDANNVRDCYAYSRRAMKYVTAEETVVKVTEVPTKNHATQVYVRLSGNALRMYGGAVIKVLADEDK